MAFFAHTNKNLLKKDVSLKLSQVASYEVNDRLNKFIIDISLYIKDRIEELSFKDVTINYEKDSMPFCHLDTETFYFCKYVNVKFILENNLTITLCVFYKLSYRKCTDDNCCLKREIGPEETVKCNNLCKECKTALINVNNFFDFTIMYFTNGHSQTKFNIDIPHYTKEPGGKCFENIDKNELNIAIEESVTELTII